MLGLVSVSGSGRSPTLLQFTLQPGADGVCKQDSKQMPAVTALTSLNQTLIYFSDSFLFLLISMLFIKPQIE